MAAILWLHSETLRTECVSCQTFKCLLWSCMERTTNLVTVEAGSQRGFNWVWVFQWQSWGDCCVGTLFRTDIGSRKCCWFMQNTAMQLPSLGWPMQPDQLVEGGIPRKSFQWLQKLYRSFFKLGRQIVAPDQLCPRKCHPDLLPVHITESPETERATKCGINCNLVWYRVASKIGGMSPL